MTLHEGMGSVDPPTGADGALPPSSIDEGAAARITGRGRDAMALDGSRPASDGSSRTVFPSGEAHLDERRSTAEQARSGVGPGEARPAERRTPPPLPWLAWAPGERVVVRYRLEDGLHDALGTLVETALDHVVVETRRGTIRVEASTMVTGKQVPPPPSFTAPADRA